MHFGIVEPEMPCAKSEAEVLTTVLQAVFQPLPQLFYTFLLITIVILQFGLFAFYKFGEDFLAFELDQGLLDYVFSGVYAGI